MRILALLCLFICLIGCDQEKSRLMFIPEKCIELKNIKNFTNAYKCLGTYEIRKDSVISKFKVDGKYSLLVIKLKNVTKDAPINAVLDSHHHTSGYFSVVNEELYDLNVKPSIFDENYKINKIDFFAEKSSGFTINNDTIKSFTLNFNHFVLKVNDDNTKIMASELESLELKDVQADFLFYKMEDLCYFFILTPVKGGRLEGDKIIYKYLFGK